MDSSWQPAPLAEVLSRIASESRDFEPVDQSQWTQCSVTPFKATIRRSDEFGEESVFVIARDDQAVIFFDDAEDGFGGAKLNAKGGLQGSRLYGELKHALRGFRRGAT